MAEPKKNEKPNCYKCEFRRSVPGNAHSRCNHPVVEAEPKSPVAEVMSLLGGGRAMPMPSKAARILNIQAVSHGIRSGWFAWPYNFDPVWLTRCDGFTKSEEKADG